MNRELEEILYKCVYKSTIKDRVEIYKLMNKDVSIIIRYLSIILLVYKIMDTFLSASTIVEFLVKIIVYLILSVLLWNIIPIQFYLSTKKKPSQDSNIIVTFYENHFEVESEGEIMNSYDDITYSQIKKRYITKDYIIIKCKTPVKYIMVKKNHFTIGKVQDFNGFLNNSIRNGR